MYTTESYLGCIKSLWFQNIFFKLSSYSKKYDYSYVTECEIKTQNDKPKIFSSNFADLFKGLVFQGWLARMWL